MKRFDEKVKDIVEVRSSSSLSDFLVDPADTLAGYHFTDITSDLMAKWVDRVADVKKGSGAALALAGFRGVGKSHFLATLGAIVSQPELRTSISDSHVAVSAQRLSRRHGVVAHVRRGSAETLLAELKNAISDITAARGGELGDSIGDLMAASTAKSGDLPPVIVIDTESGRETRVTRDDGLLLSDIAAAAVELGIFVGLALDDDIAGADGINSSIASSFEIDYLDQEHLYKIVNAHVFTKNELRRPVLHEIYESYRQSMPGFRWSENRFTSLYPLHPVILEIAPFVRLYLHDFALLGFASEAGVKILGRPANSLIGLDEVFDSVEDRLRNVGEMKEAFAVYDSLDRDVVSKAPVMKRHEAKLVLKGLFLLSLTGEGVAATELTAAMLMFDERDAAAASSNVEAVLRAFATAMPASVRVANISGVEKYSFKAGSEDDINAALDGAIGSVSPDVIWPILRRQTAEKFSDLGPTEHDPAVSAKCRAIWRGSIRRGEIVWSGAVQNNAALTDWRVFIAAEGLQNAPAVSGEACDCEWRLGELTAADVDTLKRFHVLQTDTDLRARFRDTISTVLHMHLIAVEKIWQRVFLEDGHLTADRTEYLFSEEARAAHTLSQLFSIALADYFSARFPAHPEFREVLQDAQTAQLVEHLFSTSAPVRQDVQKLAAELAAPLGLVAERDGVYSPRTAAELLDLPVIKAMLSDAPVGKNGVLGIAELSARMKQSPYGLTREAQHLVLAALVAQRQFEFVTSTGNRINHRSLDLQIVWDDIIGLAEPSEETYSNERLVKWAAALTGDASLKSLRTAQSRQAAIDALSGWLADWRSAAVVDRFDRLSDDKLNTRLWRLALGVRKTFGAAADAIELLIQDAVELDQCLQTIADAFWDSDEEHQAKLQDLTVLKTFLDRSAVLIEISEYLLTSEQTGDAAIDGLRVELLDRLSHSFDGGDENDDLDEGWAQFKVMYVERYAERHDVVARSASDQLDQFLSSSVWTIFSDLTPSFGRHGSERAMALVRQIRSLRCAANVRDLLTHQPHCNCAFSLPDSKEAGTLVAELQAVVHEAIDDFRERLSGFDDITIIELLDREGGLAALTAAEIHKVKTAVQNYAVTQTAADGQHPSHRPHPRLSQEAIRELEDQLNALGPL